MAHELEVWLFADRAGTLALIDAILIEQRCDLSIRRLTARAAADDPAAQPSV